MKSFITFNSQQSIFVKVNLYWIKAKWHMKEKKKLKYKIEMYSIKNILSNERIKEKLMEES